MTLEKTTTEYAGAIVARALLNGSYENRIEGTKSLVVSISINTPEMELQQWDSFGHVGSFLNNFSVPYAKDLGPIKYDYQNRRLLIKVSFPADIRRGEGQPRAKIAQYFPSRDRLRFLRDYSLHRVAKAFSEDLVSQGYADLASRLEGMFPNPRHAHDLRREALLKKMKGWCKAFKG